MFMMLPVEHRWAIPIWLRWFNSYCNNEFCRNGNNSWKKCLPFGHFHGRLCFGNFKNSEISNVNIYTYIMFGNCQFSIPILALMRDDSKAKDRPQSKPLIILCTSAGRELAVITVNIYLWTKNVMRSYTKGGGNEIRNNCLQCGLALSKIVKYNYVLRSSVHL